MADISKIKIDSIDYNIKDSRLVGIDTEPTENSNNLITSGAVYEALEIYAIRYHAWGHYCLMDNFSRKSNMDYIGGDVS